MYLSLRRYHDLEAVGASHGKEKIGEGAVTINPEEAGSTLVF